MQFEIKGGLITEVFIFAGFMDSGKTTALQGVLLRNRAFTEKKVLIICTEEGECEYDEELLKEKNIEIEYIGDEDIFTEDYLIDLTNRHDVDCVYIEFNGIWNLKLFISEKIPQNWDIVNVFSLVDASTYDVYLQNMRQIIMTPLSVSDVILFNRCTEDTRKGDIRRALKILNNRAEVYFAKMDGSIDDGVDELLLPDAEGNITIDDSLFCPWFIDCIENTNKYYGKKIKTRVMVTRGAGLAKNQFYAGRMAAVCCAEDAQFIGFIAECDGIMPRNGEWLDIVATIEQGVVDEKRVIIMLAIEEMITVEAPEDIFLYI